MLKKITTLLFTAFADQEILRQAIVLKVFDFLDKPLQLETLSNRLNNIFIYNRNQNLIKLLLQEFLENYNKEFNFDRYESMSLHEQNSILETTMNLISIKNIKKEF